VSLVLLLLLAAATVPGCRLFRPADVQDAPAAQETGTGAEGAEDAEAPPPDVEPLPEIEPPPVVEPEPEPVEQPAETETDSIPEVAEAPQPEEDPSPNPAPPPAKKPAKPETDSVPEVDEVSLVAPAQPEPRLLPDEKQEVSAESLRSDLEEAEKLSAVLAVRELTEELDLQVDSGRAFLEDARKALEAEDLERAGVLLQKCLVLLRDAEYNSRT
jgi:outer membrane biosynthesis protein TonB